MIKYTSMKVDPALRLGFRSSYSLFHLIGVITTHIKKGGIQRADNVFQVGIRQVSTAQHQVYVFETLFDLWAVDYSQFHIADGQQFH